MKIIHPNDLNYSNYYNSIKSINNNIIVNLDRVIIVCFSNDEKAGITLENYYTNKSKKQYGVRVKNLIKRDNCYRSGLRIGNIILYMNNIQCIDHKQSIDIIEDCTNKHIPLICVLNKNIF